MDYKMKPDIHLFSLSFLNIDKYSYFSNNNQVYLIIVKLDMLFVNCFQNILWQILIGVCRINIVHFIWDNKIIYMLLVIINV